MKAQGYSPLSPAAFRASGRRCFIIHYLNGNLRHMAKDGHSMPIRAESPEQAVTFCFGMPADRWEGDYCWKWTDMPDGGLKCRVEEVTS